MNSSLPVRLATWALAFVIGAFYGLAGTIGHSYAIVGIPVGLVVAIIGWVYEYYRGYFAR